MSRTWARFGFRASVAGFLAAALACAPALAAARPLGVVIQAQNAHLRSAVANNGLTVFAGDTLATDAGGLLRVRMGSAQVYLQENSRATVDEFSGSISAGLQRGTVGFSSTGETPVTVHASSVWVHPQSPEPTHGEVAAVSAREFLITSYRGTVEVTVNGETQAVPQGSSYKVTLDDTRRDPAGAGAREAVRYKMMGYVISAGIIAGGVTLILLKNAVSPSIP